MTTGILEAKSLKYIQRYLKYTNYGTHFYESILCDIYSNI